MQPTASRFSRLVELAKESSSDKRRELLREVTDVFLGAAPECSETEKSYFGDIMGKVSTGMDVAVRKQLAIRLADNPDAPLALMQQLARDENEVAREVLSRSPVLKDADLISIAGNRDQDKLSAIARRRSVTEPVSDAIVEHGEDNVVCALVSNAGAKVSRKTFSRVVERSETSPLLQAPLVNRNDLPVDMLNEMFTFVKADLRPKVQAKIAETPPDVLEQALKDAQREVIADVKQVRDADRKAMVYVGEMVQQKRLNEALLVELTRANRPTALIHAFARLAEVDVNTVRRLFRAGNVEGIAIICRAMRFERGTFSTIVLSLLGNRGNATKNVNEVLELYEQVTAESAQRVMRFWRIRREIVEQFGKY